MPTAIQTKLHCHLKVVSAWKNGLLQHSWLH
uniref:Uncharacterized protein n=1 Tax=Arundo donax TaxID=35708 RepID=A0A0A9GRG5_ARUDO